ncbi:hypothetical protein GF406_14530 [candidate division KSB1 bacterium]|nr:hypothetical protein [candidate division KSB1 bacterium]
MKLKPYKILSLILGMMLAWTVAVLFTDSWVSGLLGGIIGSVGTFIALEWLPNLLRPIKETRKEPELFSTLQIVQISQVFLFNTLHNISALMDIDADKARRTIEKLAEYVRATMEVKREPFTLLGHELKCVDLYLAIEKARLDNRFEVNFEIQADSHEIKIPSLLLQPLIEAAFRFGVENHAETTDILIATRKDNSSLIIEVRDTAENFDPREQGNEKGRQKLYERVQETLWHRYGQKASFEAKPIVPSGMSVLVRLPIA